VAFGERDLTIDEVKRLSRRMFGDQGSTYVDGKTRTFVVAVFTDGKGQRPMKRNGHPLTPDKRPEKVLGRGRTWTEAFERARETINNPSEGVILVS